MSQQGINTQPEVYHIPQNMSENGKIMDVISFRNVGEAIVIFGILAFIFHNIITVPFAVSFLIYGIGIAVAVVPYGVNSDTLSTYLMIVLKNAFNKKTYRHFVKFRKKKALPKQKSALVKEV